MIEVYDFKVIVSGREIETYHYKTKKISRGFTKKKKIEEAEAEVCEKREEKISPEDWAEIVEEWGCEEEKEKLYREQAEAKEKQNLKTQSSICRTRTNIRRLTNSNPHLNNFLTLTFAKSMPNLEPANNLFHLFIKRITRKYPNFEYIAVNEFQKDTYYDGRVKPEGGSVHYHLLCNLGAKYTTKEELFAWERRFALKYWQNGFIKIKEVSQITNMGAYFCKYLGKDMFDKRMFRKKKFFCSRTLQRPIELTGDKAISFFNRFVKQTKPIFEKTFNSEYVGEVDYSAYTLEKLSQY
jgi:hypothetical protein